MKSEINEAIREELKNDPEFLRDRAQHVIGELAKLHSYRKLARILDCSPNSVYNWVNGYFRISRDKAKEILRYVGEY